jgi:outer membrane immunogenic protein
MNRFLPTLIGLSALVFAQSASAADMPVKAPIAKVAAPYDWSGFYVGGHFGYLWGKTRVEENGIVTEPGAPTNGAIGGVLVGYAWQSGPLVFGLEGDFGWTHAHGVGFAVPVTPNTYDVNWTTHIRGLGGYAVDNWLFFVAGGLAVADLDFHEGDDLFARVGGKYYGWSIGGGAAYAITQNLIVRVEYLYDDYGHKDYVNQFNDVYRVSLTGQTLRGALIWKFNSLGMP